MNDDDICMIFNILKKYFVYYDIVTPLYKITYSCHFITKKYVYLLKKKSIYKFEFYSSLFIFQSSIEQNKYERLFLYNPQYSTIVKSGMKNAFYH